MTAGDGENSVPADTGHPAVIEMSGRDGRFWRRPVRPAMMSDGTAVPGRRTGRLRTLTPYALTCSQVVDGAPTLTEGDDRSGNRESTATANEIRTGSAGTTHHHHEVHLAYCRRQGHQEVNEINNKCIWEFEKSLATMLVFITEPETPLIGSNARSPTTDDINEINCTQY
jgi:hypothetical protein